MKSDTNSIDLSITDNTRSRKVIISLSLPMLLSSLATSIANVGLPTLTRAFSASFQEAQWVVLAYLLAITTSAITIGRLGDIIDKRLLLKAGIALFTLASLGCALAPSIQLLIAARVLQGLGAAAMMTLTLALVGDTVGKGKTVARHGDARHPIRHRDSPWTITRRYVNCRIRLARHVPDHHTFWAIGVVVGIPLFAAACGLIVGSRKTPIGF